MEGNKNYINSNKNNIFINNIVNKYTNNTDLKIQGKVLHYLQNMTILKFYGVIYKNTDINPFSSDINISIEFMDKSIPYVHILNDFINPTLNDGRNIFYCLLNKHQYIFNKNNLEECAKIFDEMIQGIKNFLLCLKENIQINVYIYYGEYGIGHLYQINDFLMNKNTIKFYRIIQIENGKNEEMKYLVITQLYLLLFNPDNNDMSLAKLEKRFYLKDINFALDEVILNKKKFKKTHFLKIIYNTINNTNNIYEIEFYLYSDNKNEHHNDHNDHNKYVGLKNILIGKKNEIDLKKYKIIITNYKPLFTIEIKKNNEKKIRLIENMYNDYKLYISYFEELFNYYKDFKEENIKKRVKTYLANLTYYCVEFITFYDSNPQEVKLYQSKMINYLNNKDN